LEVRTPSSDSISRAAAEMGQEAGMKIQKGDEVTCKLDGEDYTITEIVNSMIVLKSRNRERHIITGIDSLRIFYKKKAEEKSDDFSPSVTIKNHPPK
jgi:hypothetical protein